MSENAYNNLVILTLTLSIDPHNPREIVMPEPEGSSEEGWGGVLRRFFGADSSPETRLVADGFSGILAQIGEGENSYEEIRLFPTSSAFRIGDVVEAKFLPFNHINPRPVRVMIGQTGLEIPVEPGQSTETPPVVSGPPSAQADREGVHSFVRHAERHPGGKNGYACRKCGLFVTEEQRRIGGFDPSCPDKPGKSAEENPE